MPTLDWMTRGDDVRAAGQVPYRLLEAQVALDGGDGDPANMLIQGDNLDTPRMNSIRVSPSPRLVT